MSKKETPKEKCPHCRSESFAVATNPTLKRHCQKCGHVWLPLNLTEIRLQEAQLEIHNLKQRLAKYESLKDGSPDKEIFE